MRNRMFLVGLLIALLISGSVSAANWSGWFLGASGDVFWDQPAEKMFSKPRLQLSKVFQVGEDPKLVSMPGLAWRTLTGEVAPELNMYHQFLTHGHWEFLAGAGVSPLIIQTSDGGDIAKKGSVMLDLIARYGLSDKFGFIGGLKLDWQAPYGSPTVPEDNLGTVMTLTLGVNADFLGF